MKIYFIRHGKTIGNINGRYVGTTDEAILQSEQSVLAKKRMEFADFIFTSPMLRCRQTCELLYPHQKYEVVSDFREMNFGDFEYKNYKELDGNQDYQIWIDNQCKSQIPNGENKAQFSLRCTQAFEQVMEKIKVNLEEKSEAEHCKSVAFVVHGGTIMSILEAFVLPKQDYFAWQVQNGSGFSGIVSCVKGKWIITIESKIDS